MSLRQRVGLVLAVLALAPVCAEFSSGYLPSTGKPLQLLGELVFFAPLYGGAALLVRELAVRLRGGWPTRLLLAAAFGLAMPGLIDLSLFTTRREDVSFWQEIFDPTWVAALGTSPGAATTWTVGHVVLSVAAPLAVVEALTRHPAAVREPWLRLPGLLVTTALFVVVLGVVNDYQRDSYGISVSSTQLSAVGLLVLGLVAAAVLAARWFPATTRATPAPGGWAATPLLLGTGAVVMLSGDVSFLSWPALLGAWAVLLLVAVALLRTTDRRGWSPRSSALVVLGALAARAATAFASPAPDGVSSSEKLAHNLGFAALVVLLLVLVLRHRSPSPADADTVSPWSSTPSSSTGAAP